MIIDRIFTPGLAQVAYLIADESARTVAVIDPRRDVDVYVAWARERGFAISAILETHVHADFVSGAPELAAATGAPIYASRLGNEEFAHHPLDDLDIVEVGGLRLRAFWTPGHTPEHMSYLLVDPSRGPEPIALFSGDALFVGDVGRPDLLGATETQRLAEQLFETVRYRFSALDDDVIVYPGHTAGSACGKKLGDAPDSTIGQEKQSNYAFQPRTQEEFVHAVLDGMPPAPTYYPVLKRVNKTGAALEHDLAPGRGLSVGEVERMRGEGALLIDARSADAFGAGHIPGSVFTGLGSNFVAWMGWIAPYERDIVLLLDRDSDFEEARTELRRIGLDRVAGYLVGGLDAWRSEDRPVRVLSQMTSDDLAVQLESETGAPVVLDVRSADEWASGHIAGAEHHFAGEIAQGAMPSLDRSQPIAVICGTGYRSSVAASLMENAGFTHLTNVIGGMEAWTGMGLPMAILDNVETPAAAAAS